MAFRGGSGCGGGGGHGRGGGRFANFQCQVCLKFGHTASVCHYRFDQYYQPNSTLVLHDPLSPNYSQATSTQSQKITTIIHRIVTIMAKILVILDLLMFELITITNLPVTIISPILVLCSQMLNLNPIPLIGFQILVLHFMLLENHKTSNNYSLSEGPDPVLSNGGYGGAMAVLCGGFFEKTPPNSGGVAGFKWRCHGGRRRLNDGGRMAVMMEETFF